MSTPNKEKPSHVLLHNGALKHKSDKMKQLFLEFSESELFEYFRIGLVLRSHGLLLTSDQQYKKTDDMLHKLVN